MSHTRKFKRGDNSWLKRLWNNSPFVTKLAVNMDSLSNISRNGVALSPRDLIEIYRKTNILFYRGEKPQKLGKSWFCRTKFIDMEEIGSDDIDNYEKR